MTIEAGSVVIDQADATETKSGLAEPIYDAFIAGHESDTGVPLPGDIEALIPARTNYATLATRIASGLIGYLSEKLYTPEQGLVVELINKTGAPSVKGSVVEASTLVDGAFALQDNKDDAMGIVYDDGIADGDVCRVITSGIADVLLNDGAGATRGDWIGCHATDGRAYANGPPPAATIHFEEIGHCLQTVAGGVDVLCRVALHFN